MAVDDDRWPEYPSNPFIIPIQQPALAERGGIIVADFDNDGLLDYAISTKDDPSISETTKATIGVYAHRGEPLWVKSVDLRVNKGSYGLPGLHGPGIGAADVDGDNEMELVHLNTKDELVIRDGATGKIEKVLDLPSTGNIGDFWGQFQLVNLQGRGDREAIIQADTVGTIANRRNKWPLLTAISLETGRVLWTNGSYDGLRHGGFRAADLDGDGLDEVAGGVLIDHDGKRMNRWNYRKIVSPGHLDALYIADLKPDVPGLEVVILEEGKKGDDRVAIVNPDRVFTYASRNGDEPQNAAIGNFDPQRPGLEIWCRSRFDLDLQPWVLASDGDVIAEYKLNDKKPGGWTDKGIEVIFKIDWYGGPKDFIAAKERHTEGDIALLDAMTGKFIRTWDDKAARIYVADVSGDYREEIITVNSSAMQIRVYWNEEVNNNT